MREKKAMAAETVNKSFPKLIIEFIEPQITIGENKKPITAKLLKTKYKEKVLEATRTRGRGGGQGEVVMADINSIFRHDSVS